MATAAAMSGAAYQSGCALDSMARVAGQGGTPGQAALMVVRQAAAAAAALGVRDGPWACPSILGALGGTLLFALGGSAQGLGGTVATAVLVASTGAALYHYGPQVLAQDARMLLEVSQRAHQGVGRWLRHRLPVSAERTGPNALNAGIITGVTHWLHQWITVPAMTSMGHQLAGSRGAMVAGVFAGAGLRLMGPCCVLGGYLAEDSLAVAGDTLLGTAAGTLGGGLLAQVLPHPTIVGLAAAAGAVAGFCWRSAQDRT